MMKISTLLRKAANEHLWDGENYYNHQKGEVFSCLAVRRVVVAKYPVQLWDPQTTTDKHNILLRRMLYGKALAFLEELGCSTGSMTAFSEFKVGKKQQAVRYAWLMFAAQVAKEEGL